MNIEVIKGLGFILVCGLVGAYAGKLLAEKVLEEENKKFVDFANSEDSSDWEKMDKGQEVPELIEFEQKKTKEEMKKVKRKVVRDYSKFSKEKLGDLAKKYIEEEPEELVVDTSKPYIITAEEYEENDRFTKASLTYYLDDVLVDEDENPIPNQDDLLGPDALTQFGVKSNDPDIIYVRNEKIAGGMDYEISRIAGNYSEIVLGLPPESLSTKRRRNKKVTHSSGQEDE